jgi:hypothetical protein
MYLKTALNRTNYAVRSTMKHWYLRINPWFFSYTLSPDYAGDRVIEIINRLVK